MVFLDFIVKMEKNDWAGKQTFSIQNNNILLSIQKTNNRFYSENQYVLNHISGKDIKIAAPSLVDLVMRRLIPLELINIVLPSEIQLLWASIYKISE